MSGIVIFKSLIDIFENELRFFNFAGHNRLLTMTRTILTTIAVFLSLHILSAKEQYVYRQISQKEGLTSTVNCICKEKDGDVWIGTPTGLYRFNGYSLTHYNGALQGSRRVFHVSMDENGDLWVLTEKHILKSPAGSDRFIRISETTVPYFSMLHDKDCIWIGSRKNIYRYSDNRLEPLCTIDSPFDCRSMAKIDDHTLLCCSNNGKFLIDTRNGEISDAPYGDISEVSAALVDDKGRIWLAFYNNGIEVYEKDGTRIRKYSTGNSSLSNDIVLCLEQRDSLILAGTDGGGINIINPENDTIHVLSHVSGDRSSFPAHSIKSIHTDHYGNIWAGSIRDGLISISRSRMTTYRDTYVGHSNGLSNPTVLCLHQDKTDGVIWIGTDGEGINRFDPKSARFTHYEKTLKTKTVSIADFSDNELVVSMYGDNVYRFDKKTGKIRPLLLYDKDLHYQIRHSGRSVNLHNEPDGDLLLFSNALHRYDKSTGTCRKIATDVEIRHKSNFMIIAGTAEGVWMHDNTNVYFLRDDSDTLSMKGTHRHGNIRNGHLAADGTIWLATEEGLCRFDTKTYQFSHITTTIFADANSVVCDNHSRVWIGTEKGLSAYLIDSGSFAFFGESDGVQPNEYLPKPHLLTRDGEVYLGGVQGLLRIHEDFEMDTSEDPAIKLVDLSIDGAPCHIDGNADIKVPRHSKTMDIEVGVAEKDMFRHRVYRFALSDKEVYETAIPHLILQRMPEPGRYEVTVSCTKRNGEWTEPFRLMSMVVPKPWFLTWGFLCGCLLFLVLIYTTAIYSINRRKQNELKMAMKEQEQKVYEEKVQMLINVSHELRTPLTLIMAPLKRLLKDVNPDDENYHVMGRIYRQSRRMRSLLDMVLDLRKMEVGGNRLKIENLEFNAWIAGCVDDIVNEEKAEGINVVYDFDTAVGYADFDRQKCDIVLMNILINAIKHSSAGDTVTIRTALTDNGMIRTSISDQGPGLGADIDPSKMFTRFYQGNSEKYGSGIGLSYSKILIEMHGGNIGVYNNPDKGATFWWEIPVSASVETSETEPKAYLNELLGYSTQADTIAPVEDSFSTSGMKLMIVDDNKDLLDFLREALCQDFAEVITVTGGNPALRELMSGRLPDIIVSDVNMPDGDGFKLCSDLKKNEKFSHIPVILLTARGEDQSQSDSYRLGADGFLAKPFEIETLMEMIRGLLRSKAEIRRRYLDEDSVAEADYGSNEERFILQLNKIVSEHMSDPGLDQQLICMELGVSRALLYNKMKAITGAGAKEYITKIRIEKAKSLIETTSLSIADISEMTGFSAQSYFSTAFKNYTGMTPSQYKQKVKAEKNESSE